MLFIYCGPMQYLPSLVFYSIPPSELESLQLFVTPEKSKTTIQHTNQGFSSLFSRPFCFCPSILGRYFDRFWAGSEKAKHYSQICLSLHRFCLSRNNILLNPCFCKTYEVHLLANSGKGYFM